MVKIYCDNINPTCWAWVSEYALRKKIKRCEALQQIIEDHIRFTKMMHDMLEEKKEDGKTKKKQ